MTRQLKRSEERKARKAETRSLCNPEADHDVTAARFTRKLTAWPLTRIQRELRRTYNEAIQMNRVLLAYRMKHEGEQPLLTAPEAPVALAIGNKFYYILSEMRRRGMMLKGDVPLGGTAFQSFFAEVADRTERLEKETATAGFFNRFTKAVGKLMGSRKQ